MAARCFCTALSPRRDLPRGKLRGSDRGGVRAAAMYTLIGTAKLNNVDPQAWLADALGRIAGTPQTRLDELLPWNWKDNRRHDQAA